MQEYLGMNYFLGGGGGAKPFYTPKAATPIGSLQIWNQFQSGCGTQLGLLRFLIQNLNAQEIALQGDQDKEGEAAAAAV